MEVVQEEKQQGFIRTKLGWYPEDWETKRLIELCSNFKSGQGITSKMIYDKGDYSVFGGNGLRGFTDDYTHDGDFVLIGRQGALCGNVVRISGRNYVSEHAIAAQTNARNSNDFLAYKLDFLKLNRFSESSAQPGLSVDKISKLKITVPELSEQKAIANVLSTWDKAIENLTQLITEKQQKKKALMQQLLTGKKRFPGFDGEWKEVKLGDVFERIRETGEDIDDESEAYTISSKLGFVTQHQKFDRVIAGSSLKKYTLIRRDEFSYNKGNSKTFPYGCIFKFEQDHGLIPFVYISFRSTGEVSIDFYKHYFFFGMLERQLKKIITSGARGDGLLNVNPDSFFKLMIDLPPIEEQQKIAEVLNSATKEIELLKQKLDALKDQKKGLMQQLLTGKKRLSI